MRFTILCLSAAGMLASFDVPDEVWRISPTSQITYSVLVILLAYIAWRRDSDARATQKKLEDFVTKYLEPKQDD